jgi:hypothetical protein
MSDRDHHIDFLNAMIITWKTKCQLLEEENTQLCARIRVLEPLAKVPTCNDILEHINRSTFKSSEIPDEKFNKQLEKLNELC